MVWLNAEVLVNLLFLCVQEPFDFLDSSVFHKSGTVFQRFVLVCVGVVSHQEFGKEDARVETSLDALVDFSLLGVDKSVDLAREILEAWDENWINFFGQVDVEMLGASW